MQQHPCSGGVADEPRAVVVHTQDAAVADVAVVGARRLLPIASLAAHGDTIFILAVILIVASITSCASLRVVRTAAATRRVRVTGGTSRLVIGQHRRDTGAAFWLRIFCRRCRSCC